MSETTEGCCRLCGNHRVLQHSHLLPKALYKIIRNSNPSGSTNPVVVNPREARQTSRQVTAHLLCSECEQRFSTYGENWTMQYCFRSPGSFLLQDLLNNAPAIALPDGNGRVINAASVPSLALDQLVYFAMSVFWRASVHAWKLEGHELKQIAIRNRYESEFRQYLLGNASFPANTAIQIFVSDNPAPLETAIFPYGQRIWSHYRYKFMLPGIMFFLYIGGIPKHIREMCTFTSHGRPIYFGRLVETQMMISSIQLMKDAKPCLKLRNEWNRRGVPS
jgi:hypothetical protein